MEFIARLKAALQASISEVVKSGPVEAAASLSAKEVDVKPMLHEVGNTVLSEWQEGQDGKYAADRQACDGGQQAEYVRRRAGVRMSLMGRVSYRRA
jgi:hypothetical protein